MKISIWQQFSSNHSASFALVGEFESPEKAAEAAEKIRYILREVASYWQSLPESEQSQLWSEKPHPPTPIENRLSEEFGVSWSDRYLDWMPPDPSIVHEAVILFDHCVFIYPIGNTWVGTEPFDRLLEKWGAQVAAWREVEATEVFVTVTCLAPNELTADRILADMKAAWLGDPERHLFIANWLVVTDDHDIRREGRKLIYPRLSLYPSAVSDFPRFITYLEAQGCTEIEYKFEQED